uniref:Dishevelled binding antagonist of beta catenin 3 n=1 Tax=Sus scrofa TaxID=9823 RepID=A0A4X1VWB5_PIG
MQIRRGWAAQWTGAYADETVTAGPAGGRAGCWGGEVGPGEGWPRGPAGLGRGAAAMIRAFSFPVSPERGRLRGWLEGSLAGLCELHWLRERQEYRVQQALRLAQPGMGGAEAEDEEDADEDEDAAAARRAAAALEEQLEALPGLIWDLGQQLGDLSLESGGLEQESGRSSGFYEDPSSTGGPDSPPSTFCGDSGFSGSGSYGRLGPSEPRGIYASERPNRRPAFWAAPQRFLPAPPSTLQPNEKTLGRRGPAAVQLPRSRPRPQGPAAAGAPPLKSTLPMVAEAGPAALPPEARGPAHPRQLLSAVCSTAARAATQSARPGAWGPSDAGARPAVSAAATGRVNRAPARGSRLPSAPHPATLMAAVASCGRSSWWQPPRPPGQWVVQVEGRPRAPPKSL